jgi:hypothetical protein
VALALALLLLAAVEAAWRLAGARPSYIESHARWAMVREGVERADHPRRTAILGTSRILFNLSLDTFAKRHPGVPVAQLAIPARGPLKTLETFAYQTDFNGVLLLDFDPESLLPPRENEQADYLSYYASRWSIDQAWNLRVASLLEPRLVTRHYNYGIDNLARTWLTKTELPTAALYLSVHENREHDADFSLVDAGEMVRLRIDPLLARYRSVESMLEVEWPRTQARVAAAVSAIHQRGGCVVLVRTPESGRWLELQERFFGTGAFWTQTVAAVGAYGVDLLQAGSLFKLPLPDGQHLDHRDQARFTELLIDRLDALGIYSGERPCRPTGNQAGVNASDRP